MWRCREFRSLVIDMVLATDMSFHFQQVKNMKNLLSMPDKLVYSLVQTTKRMHIAVQAN